MAVPCLRQVALLGALAFTLQCGGSPHNDAAGQGPIGDAGNSNSTPNTLTPSLASRTTGVAPLYVFFDATALPDIAQPAVVSGRREYADLKYQWDFGDPNAGTWGTDGLAKNLATGYVAAHVFENPGTYTATVTVTTATGTDQKFNVNITVDDPNVVYAGTATTCVSTGSTFDGCPSGAQQVTTTDFNQLQNYVASGKRVLLRRGDTWASTGSASLDLNDVTGPTTIGAFGACAQADRFGICSNAPLIDTTNVTAADNELFRLWNTNDLRVMDLNFYDGTSASTGSIFLGSIGMAQILGLRLHSQGFDGHFTISHWGMTDPDQLALVSCDSSRAGTTNVYVGGTRLALLGNSIRDALLSHVTRVWEAHRAVISHNELSGSSLNTDTGRQALKLHGPSEDQIASTGYDHLNNRTQYVIVSNNVFGSSGPWPVAICSQNDTSNEFLQDVLVEKNRWIPTFGNASCCSQAVLQSIHLCASNATVRNNLLLAEGAGSSFTVLDLEHGGAVASPQNVRVFNNTAYIPTPGGNQPSNFIFMVGAGATNTVIQNNLIQIGTSSESGPLLSDTGQGTVADHNLQTNNAFFVDAANPNVLLKDFSLTTQSPAVNAGTNVPVYDDFSGAPRPTGGQYDIGAFER
jgi:PKD repeat protein